jgi:hypothetical protein
MKSVSRKVRWLSGWFNAVTLVFTIGNGVRGSDRVVNLRWHGTGGGPVAGLLPN